MEEEEGEWEVGSTSATSPTLACRTEGECETMGDRRSVGGIQSWKGTLDAAVPREAAPLNAVNRYRHVDASIACTDNGPISATELIRITQHTRAVWEVSISNKLCARITAPAVTAE